MAVGGELRERDGRGEVEAVAPLGGREVEERELSALGRDREQPGGLRDDGRGAEETPFRLAVRERVEEHPVVRVGDDDPVADREGVRDAA